MGISDFRETNTELNVTLQRKPVFIKLQTHATSVGVYLDVIYDSYFILRDCKSYVVINDIK